MKDAAEIASGPVDSRNPARTFVAELGERVRKARQRKGVTRKRLSELSLVSQRHLAQLESGEGNISIALLHRIAAALDAEVAWLVGGEESDIAALFRAASAVERARVLEILAAGGRRQRIALIGLRGAGKSTLGRILAQHLGWPFIELDRRVEEDYGASIPDLIEMAGTATFRRQERSTLERVLAEHEAAVITTAGGIVANPETYALLLRHAHTIWIKAQPQEHMSRVMAQGDFRPMAQNRQAMADLVAILEARRADYARAQAEVDTSGDAVEQSFAKLLRIVARLRGEPTA
jgi:XRE family transcriptional regulator, aerobic/anaerobic benzoate catabolism transcriptional regulator